MKVFITVLILIFSFQSWTKADDIRDFEIEGISLGDSLFDHISKDIIGSELTSKFAFWYDQNQFVAISLWEIKETFKTYTSVGVVIKPDDYKNYQIFSLYGKLWFENKEINECYKKQNEIYSNIKNSFSNLILDENDWIVPENRVASHLISIKYRDLFLKDGKIRVVCYERKNNKDLLQVIINQTEFVDFLKDIAKNN